MNVHWRYTRRRGRVLTCVTLLGIVNSSGTLHTSEGSWFEFIGFRGRRRYLLGINLVRLSHRRACYRSQVKGRERWHRFQPTRMLGGICGACVPWPCCGATGEDHLDNCEEG